ncbi:thiamine phosphate synthase [Nitrosophilus alvini]|uniref:thiamine phosphate synthase n=1 Tax=Nitrosophilus alvini TaxID=2714855 RepID=UPI001F4493C8|nr:thiamine phosphate synthase [Nitrosophilus alvini]
MKRPKQSENSMKIYALCDYELLKKTEIGFEEFVKIAKDVGAQIIQYRDKTSSLKEKKTNLLKIRHLWNGILIVNDHVELAAYADGLHLGQDDMAAIDRDFSKAVQKIRKEIGEEKILGLSTHNEEEVLAANRLSIDYIGLGAYRSTDTKEVTNILGDKLPEIAALSAHPVAAIGGVKIDDKIENVEYMAVGSDLIRRRVESA